MGWATGGFIEDEALPVAAVEKVLGVEEHLLSGWNVIVNRFSVKSGVQRVPSPRWITHLRVPGLRFPSTRRGSYRCGDRLVILKIISDHSDADAARAADRRSPALRRLLLGYAARYSSIT
jgi:hypothetical protein